MNKRASEHPRRRESEETLKLSKEDLKDLLAQHGADGAKKEELKDPADTDGSCADPDH